ncbi:hypothetical protein KAW50_03230 [candidate division WOR-3 bacterium]|nr:hypothetical protein [candidate division WOR-3 bacterium]
MGGFLTVIGFIGIIASFVWLIVAFAKKKRKKNPLISLIGCLVLLVIGGALLPIDDKGSETFKKIKTEKKQPAQKSRDLKVEATELKAERKKGKRALTLSKKEEERIIEKHCAREWPDDFRMRAYCEKQQREGLATLKLGKPNDISGKDFQVVRSKCAREWPDDFRMRAYCEKQQFEAIRELRK